MSEARGTIHRMSALIAGLFGLIVGSFLNVVILRRGVQGLGGRSACPRCGHTLAWPDLIPVLSWLFLRGRCRYCGSPVSIQYPLVEAATAILFALLFAAPFAAGIGYRLVSCLVVALLVCIFVYDLRHTIIPDSWAYSFAALSLLSAFASGLSSVLAAPYLVLLTLASGPLAALPLFFLWAVSRGRWMGFGDVKLALGIGWLLGPAAGIFATFGAFVLGSVILVPLMYGARLVTHRGGYAQEAAGLTMKSEVPFGPFLIASTLIVWLCLLFGIDLPALAGW